MYANNRLGEQPRALFRTAGGSIYTFAHPFLTGQIAEPGETNIDSLINEVNISRSLRLNDTFFNAQPAQDNALQEVMVDGSTITITNHLMNGRATLQVMPGSNLVGDGDLIAIAPFIMSSKDNVGGVLTRKRFVSAGAMTRIYYGVTFANFPHDIDAGNAVPIYPIVMLYSGWIEGLNIDKANNGRLLWAVGNQKGLNGNFVPFDIQSGGANNLGIATEIDPLRTAGKRLQNRFENAPDSLLNDASVAIPESGMPNGTSGVGPGGVTEVAYT